MIRALLVDDEPPARARLRAILADEADLAIVGEAEDCEAALEAMEALAPDVIFLDVQMPGLDGFGVVQALPRERTPMVVFVTAYDEHAVRAFEIHAVDYLVKPYHRERLREAVARVRERLGRREREPAAGNDAAAAPPAAPGGEEMRDQLTALLATLRAGKEYLARVAVRLGERIYYVRMEEVDWVEADGNYARLHTGGGTPSARTHLLRKPLSVLASELDPRQFARIHRSSLVNIDRIKELRALYDGEYQVLLVDGTKLKLSKTFRGNLPEF